MSKKDPNMDARRELAEEKMRESAEAAKAKGEVDEGPTEAEEKVEQLEENPPEKLEDWPKDEAKYVTFGGPEHETGYEEAATKKLGPSGLRHHEDGSVSIDGEKVDNPEDYKGDPIPGGPTDPDNTDVGVKTREEKKEELEEQGKLDKGE